jgi:hypothetical protein
MRCILVSAAGLLVIAGSAGSSIGWDGASGMGGRSSVRNAEGFILMETLTLVADNGAVGDGFGHSVARDGNVVAAGWSGTLEEDATLVPSDAAEDDLLGISVAVAAGTAVVGAEQNPFGNAGPGAAYVFDASTVFADGFESGDLAAWSAAVP